MAFGKQSEGGEEGAAPAAPVAKWRIHIVKEKAAAKGRLFSSTFAKCARWATPRLPAGVLLFASIQNSKLTLPQ